MSVGAPSFHRVGVTAAGFAGITACSLTIAIGVTFIGASLLAVVAFTNGITIDVPSVATFRGFVVSNGSHEVTVNGSWAAALALILLLTTPMPIVVMTRHRYRP